MTGGPDPKNHPICIVGGGLVGKVAALELAARATPDNGPYANRPIALIAPEMPSADRRTTAMLMPQP